MAKQTVNIGNAANSGDGEPLRTAFDKLNDNFDEVYANGFVTSDRVGSGAINASKLDVTAAAGTTEDDYVLSYDHASGGFTWVVAGDITGVVAGDGLTGDATSGDASLAVGAGTGITVNSNDIQISNNGVDHDQLANRYTARAAAVTTSGATTLDWSSAAIFPVTMGGSHTINFSSYKKGQVVDIIVSGAYTITLGTLTGTPAINQVGSGTYDNTTTNLIQVTCTDDDATPEFFYSVGTYSADTDPA
jgi:hypothetical protein